jgi:hypothetical protein
MNASNGFPVSRLRAGLRMACLLAACIPVFFWTGCASSSGTKSQAAKGVILDSRQALYVPDPVVADSADSALARMGWGGGRFARELKKEILFQFNRKGVPTVEDSVQAKARLEVSLARYSQESAGASGFDGSARLATPEGERSIGFKKEAGGAEAPERDDPTVDNIRKIASTLVDGARRDPKAEKEKSKNGPEYTPTMMIIF